MSTLSAYYETGATVRAIIRNDALQFADVVAEAMDSYNAADIDDYDTACTEIGSTGEYHFTWPTWLAVDNYNVQFVPLAGGSIAESDMLNRFASGNWYWDGTNLLPDWAVKLATVASPVADSIEHRVKAVDTLTKADGDGDLAALAGKFTGITLLAKWLRGLFRKDTMDATAKTEVNLGGGTYDEATDSVEAIREQVDDITSGAGAPINISTEGENLSSE